jgi:hypothetical protein
MGAAAVLLIFLAWREIVAVALAALEWVESWPSWVWICLCILTAANRIVSAIDRQAKKAEK